MHEELFFIFLTSCTGTGTKNLSAINFEVPDNDFAVFVVRKKRYTASAQLVKISLPIKSYDNSKMTLFNIFDMI